MYIIIIFGRLQTNEASLVAQTVKSLPAMQETWIWSLGWEDPLEKEMATHSSNGFLSSVQFSRSVVSGSLRSIVSDSLRPRGLQHTKPPCPSPTFRAYSNSCPLHPWYHPTISSSVVPFSSCLQSFPASGSFQMSQLFASGGPSIEVSASTSVLPMNTQDDLL